MVVAVQKGLGNLKDQLRERGYEVVTLGEYNYPIDAVVYTGSGLELSYIKNNNIPNLSSHMPAGLHSDRSYGVLLINATNRTAEEIDRMLQRKSYSPLF